MFASKDVNDVPIVLVDMIEPKCMGAFSALHHSFFLVKVSYFQKNENSQPVP